jgi:aspartyl-tRNA(Asn)/glutamyl-tRNA(Gln) amidotransferase subunit B
MGYTIVIGLEVHVQLLTESKMFSSCGTEFGLPPNTQTDPVSLGLPGTLPVMNRRAFELALKTAVALNAEVAPFTKWDRKNYYYPDLPKNYQISQYDLPFSRGGWLEIPVQKDGSGGGRCRLTRVHLEEDTGKLTHGAGGDSEVDLNRAGIPLLEIVTEPDLRSAQDAKACLEELRLTLRYLGVSDCEMQEGSLRCDANVNLHIDAGGKTVATPIVEVKNLNSFRSVERAMEYEAERQYRQWQQDGLTIKDAPKETRGWSDPEGVTKPQRRKETAADYRYFPEPDLVPVVVDEAWLGRVRASIGELPAKRRKRFETEYGLSAYDANVLVEQGQDVADYYDAVARSTGEYKVASNWVQQDVLRTIKEKKLSVAEFPVGPEKLADLINRVKGGELNTNQGREVLGKMIETGGSADAIIEAGGYKMVSDRGAIAAAVEAALAANPKAVEDLKGGKKKPEAVKGFLRGQVMKQSGGKADPALVGQLLDAKLAELGF